MRYGFIRPGDAIGSTGRFVNIHAGASYGVGIYSSPDPLFASSYTGVYGGSGLGLDRITRPSDLPGMRLLVCATLMGRALEVARSTARRVTEILDETANSHVSPCGMEYIVFDSMQIIPCYVRTYYQLPNSLNIN